MTIVYLDSYFLGDPLFIPGLARDVAARGTGLVLVHGSGERGERALESLGRTPTATDGVWNAEDAEGRDAVERATRTLLREIVHELNEAGVSAIGALGSGRGLLKQTADGLAVGKASWLGDLVQSGVVAVVASLVAHEDGLVEVDAARASGALADALDLPVAVLTTRSVDREGTLTGQEDRVPDAEAVRRTDPRGGLVRAGMRTALRDSEGPAAVLILD